MNTDIFNERITKKSDLHNHDSLSSYYGNLAQQNHNVYKVFYDLLTKVKPKRILEIGTALGGFTKSLKLMIDELKLETKILTLDINYMDWYEKIKKNGIDVRVENVFKNNYTDVEGYIKNYITDNGVVVVLCDGGDKVREFKLLSQFLKKGDIIMAHDYAPNQEYFDKHINGKIWNWLEIQDKDIDESCIKHNLVPFMEYELRDVVWVGKIKE